jgi:hypothetical protein
MRPTSALAIAGRDVHFINFLFAIGLSFRAKILYRVTEKNINFLFVYCADVPAENYKLPSHRQCVAVSGNRTATTL